MHPSPAQIPTSPLSPTDPVARFLQEDSKTAYQLYCAYEKFAAAAKPGEGVPAMHGVIAQDLSMLAKFFSKEEMVTWHKRYRECASFLPLPQLQPSSLPGVAAQYSIQMGNKKAEFLPSEYGQACEQMRLNQAAICLENMRTLHAEARAELTRRGFIKDTISAPDAEAAAAAARQAEFSNPH
jgi:hypothetical protein